jgi:hypothetical protein
MFGSYADFIKSYNLSINSGGMAETQVAAQLDTINRKIEQVKASMEGLLVNTGNSGLATGIKGMLDVINDFLKGLQKIPASAYQIAGVTAIAGTGFLVLSKTLSFLNAGLIGLSTALKTTAVVETEGTVASGVKSAALGVETVATNAATTATGRLGIAATVATGGLNLIIGALIAAAAGGAVYATALGSSDTAAENTIQKNNDLIAAKKQEIEMNQKQVEFIGTLGQSYIKLQQNLKDVGNDESKATQIKKDLGATEDELAKIVGQDGLERITTSDNIQESIKLEQEAHSKKSSSIQGEIKDLINQQVQYTNNQIQLTQDRIDALKSETSAWGLLAQAQQLAMNTYAGFVQGEIDFNNAASNIVGKDNYQALVGKASDNEALQAELDRLAKWKPSSVTEEIDALTQKMTDLKMQANKTELSGYGSGSENRIGGNETTPYEPKGKKGRKEGTGETAYQQAKKAYEEAVAAAKYQSEAVDGKKFTSNDQLYLYSSMLGDVPKTDNKNHQETLDFQKGQYELMTKKQKEQLDLQKAQLETAIAEEKITKRDAFDKEIEMLTTIRDKALLNSTEREQAEQNLYKKIKERNDYEMSIAKKRAEINKQYITDIQALIDKQIEYNEKVGLISKSQAIAYKVQQNESTYSQKSAENEKAIGGMVNPKEGNADDMIAAYRAYINAKTDLDRADTEKQIEELSKDFIKTQEFLAKGEQIQAEYEKKKRDLSQETFEYVNRYEIAALTSYKSGLEQSLNGILNKTMSWAQAMKNIFSSMWKGVASQFSTDFTQKMTKNLTQLVYGKKDTKDNKQGSGAKNNQVAQEKAVQNQLTSVVQQGVTQRASLKTTQNATEIATDQVKNTTEITANATKNAAVTASDQEANANAVKGTQLAMMQMLEMMAIMWAISALFGGGGSSTSESTSSVSLGRSPNSYYQTPTPVSQITVPSFDIGAQQLPEDTLAMVHKNEMILTPDLADNIRSLGSGNSSSGNSRTRTGNTTFNVNASAIDGRGMKHALNNSSRDMATVINKEYRNFNRPNK